MNQSVESLPARALRAGLLALAAILVAWTRTLPLSLQALDDEAAEEARRDVARRVAADAPRTHSDAERREDGRREVARWVDQHRAEFERERDERAARLKAELSYHGADGRDYVYLGDYDSYAWLRYARNYLRTGTTCDAVVDGECHDTYANAPVGRRDQYHHSLHIAAIVALHRLAAVFVPDYPLPASSFLVPVLAGVLGVFPAFAIARRLGGDLAGWCAAVLIGVNPIFLQRSMGSDTDVWNLVLPLWMMWAGTAALAVAGLTRPILYGVLAAVFAAVHAATWRGWVFTYGVLVVGLLCNATVVALRHVRRTGGRGAWRDVEVRRAFLVLAVVPVATWLLTALTGGEESGLRALVEVLASVCRASGMCAPPVTPAVRWPDALGTVAELSRPNLASIAAFMGGIVAFFVGWLGLLVLMLPRRGWQWWHFVVLIAGNYLYRYLLTAPQLSRAVLVGLLALPLAVAMALCAFTDEGAAETEQGAALTIVLWFVAALFLSFDGLRFVMLLVPPFAIACAAAIGRLYGWLVAQAAAIDRRYARVAAPVLFVGLAALALPPLRAGYATARTYRPRINDAWWETLEKLRDETPPDAVVNTWWDYGYWVKFVAERRVSADGGSLQTHILHWLGRALGAADERESIGLLRMLDCGSDATPEPEGRTGALGRLIAHGSSDAAARSMVVKLASMDRDEARAHLTANGWSEEAATDVLAASHCPPPPAYLVLSTALITQRAWWPLGRWDPSNTNVRTPSFGEPGLRWRPCRQRDDGSEMQCPVDMAIDSEGTRLESVVYDRDRPDTARLRLRPARGDRGAADGFEGTPALLLLAGDRSIDSRWISSPMYPDGAVLIDLINQRVLVGPPDLLRSTFTHLMFLDGRYARHFEKFDERTGFHGERVVTWRIDWDGH